MTAQYSLYAEIMPTLASQFTRQTESLVKKAISGTEPKIHVKPEIDKEKFGKQAKEAGKEAGEKINKAFEVAMGGFALGAGFEFFKGLIEQAEEAEKVLKITENVIRSTGGTAKVSAEHVSEYASSISNATGVQKEIIESGQNMLLTFTNVRNETGKSNDIFDQATGVITDMTAAMNHGQVTTEGMKTSSIQLGKALNDPVKGVTALTKVGVTFTQQQKDQIKTLMKNHDILGAQKIILGEVKKEFGGTAKAASTPMQKLQNTIHNMKVELGSKLLPTVDKFVELISTKMIPKIEEFGKKAAPYVTGALHNIKTAISDVIKFVMAHQNLWMPLVNAAKQQLENIPKYITEVKTALTDTFSFVQRNKQWIEPLAAGILAMVAAWKAYKTTMLIVTAIQKLWAASAGLVAFIQLASEVRSFAGAWALLNTVMELNPFVLILTGLIGLGVALVVAYKKSQTFRDIVNAVWHAIATAGLWMWNTVLKPIFNALTVAFHATMTAVSFAWNSILKPAWNAIVVAAKWLWAALHPIFLIIEIQFKILAIALVAAWKLILEPMFRAVAAVAKWLWNNALKPAFGWIKAGWNLLVTGLKIYWNTIGKPLFDAIGKVVKWLWNNIFSPVIGYIKSHWSDFVLGLKILWAKYGEPLFTRIGTVLTNMKTAFGNAVTGIKTVWQKLQDVVKAPVNFVINTIYTQGIKKFWDSIASKVGMSPLPTINGFATGGKIPGNSGMRFQDDRLASSPHGPIALAGGEYIVNAPAAKKNLGVLEAINAGRGFAGGGWLGGLWDKAKGGIRGLLTPIATGVQSAMNGMLKNLPNSNTGVGSMVKAVPQTGMQKVVDWIKGDDKAHPPAASGFFNGVALSAYSTAKSLGADQKVLLALLEAGIVESGMRNLSGGDRDSVGFLQQRPSQGWKDPMNVVTATTSFVRKAMAAEGKYSSSGALAQGIQRSAYPAKYGQVQSQAAALLAALSGGGGGTVPGGGKAFTPGYKNQEAVLAKAGFKLRFARSQENEGKHADTSWHYKNRAIDIGVGTNGQGTVEKVWSYLVSNYAKTSKELFWAQKAVNYKNGQTTGPHDLTNHVHWAYGKGGQVPTKYDQGGWLQPGAGNYVNNTGKPEAVLTSEQWKSVGTGGGYTINEGDTILNFGDIQSDVDMIMAVDRATRGKGIGR